MAKPSVDRPTFAAEEALPKGKVKLVVIPLAAFTPDSRLGFVVEVAIKGQESLGPQAGETEDGVDSWRRLPDEQADVMGHGQYCIDLDNLAAFHVLKH